MRVTNKRPIYTTPRAEVMSTAMSSNLLKDFSADIEAWEDDELLVELP